MIRFTVPGKPQDFNPRSREGSDHVRNTPAIPPANFNPRSREGSDCFCDFPERHTLISIHAPAKGATYPRFRLLFSFPFQSTLPRRERREEEQTMPVFGIFQSTLPRRERPITLKLLKGWNCHFNPRSREGSDFPLSLQLNQVFLISIHAPAKGATPEP